MTILLYEEAVKNIIAKHFKISIENISVDEDGEYSIDGIEVLKEIRQKDKELKVLILTVHNEVEYLVKAVDIGVNGYILKGSESSELKKAIFAIISGENFIQPDLIPLLNARLT